MSGYAQGRRVEYSVRDRLIADGYEVTRAASSKGTADLIAIKAGQVLLVNVKATRYPGPAERRELVRVAALLPGVGVPVVACGRNLWRITDDGADPKARAPFVTDVLVNPDATVPIEEVPVTPPKEQKPCVPRLADRSRPDPLPDPPEAKDLLAALRESLARVTPPKEKP